MFLIVHVNVKWVILSIMGAGWPDKLQRYGATYRFEPQPLRSPFSPSSGSNPNRIMILTIESLTSRLIVNYISETFICRLPPRVVFLPQCSLPSTQLVKVLGMWPLGQGYESRSWLLHLALLQSISPLCLSYRIIKNQFLSFHAYMVWEVKDPFSG